MSRQLLLANITVLAASVFYAGRPMPQPTYFINLAVAGARSGNPVVMVEEPDDVVTLCFDYDGDMRLDGRETYQHGQLKERKVVVGTDWNKRLFQIASDGRLYSAQRAFNRSLDARAAQLESLLYGRI